MKKWIKVTLIVLASILAVVSLLVIWQWNNIKSIYIGLNSSSEEISRRRVENQIKMVEEIDEYLDTDVRELTAEEKEKVDSGEVSVEEVYKEIFEEKNKELAEERNKKSDKEDTSSSSGEKTASSDKKTVKKSKDEIVTYYVAELYALQSKYTARAESTIKEGARYYENLKKSGKDKATARAETITHYTSIVRNVESECDKNVETLIANLEKELEAIGAETDITGTIKGAYETEKQLKLSYYANKYLK